MPEAVSSWCCVPLGGRFGAAVLTPAACTQRTHVHVRRFQQSQTRVESGIGVQFDLQALAGDERLPLEIEDAQGSAPDDRARRRIEQARLRLQRQLYIVLLDLATVRRARARTLRVAGAG